ncbi:hypothetical protein ACI79D_24430 [Geodermatophilus sp. SYSU D00708]
MLHAEAYRSPSSSSSPVGRVTCAWVRSSSSVTRTSCPTGVGSTWRGLSRPPATVVPPSWAPVAAAGTATSARAVASTTVIR